ncbi:MAG: NADH-quinone oxidoreductase subunit NuoG [Actinobacteria bacterium]|nr:NADH-quinone oxidoreductase subunit NuoG [Actinomycetota bacterium]MBW3649034.1 NADH-quinone oxidoreductase subunit NuoG [Actinomycetota bacterium]
MADAASGEKTSVTITVDGREIEAKPGEMIIAAAERHGVYIPRFCYHPRMRPVGMCRMCLVEVVGPRGPMLSPACFVPVADGQVVNTETPGVKKAQDGVLEFLLANHPLDCPVCDKGGECPLQDQTFAFGPGETRFVEEKRHWEKPISLSALVQLDRERCIQCDRCTRFADEVAGDALIEFVGRGAEIEINTFPDEPFSSYFSGNTVQICPVGALLAAPYRFRARPWDLEQVESTCQACAFGCRIAVQSSNDKLTRYLGLDSDPVNHGWLCDKGRFSYEAVNSALRLGHPLVRSGSSLAAASWSEALDAAAQGLSDARTTFGAESVAVIGGARLANEDAYAWAKLAKGVLGTDSVDCQLGDGLPPEVVVGLPRATIDEACSASSVVLLAPDIKEALPVLYLRLRAAAVDGKTKIIELSPCSTGLTRYAAAVVGYAPGEAAAAARALAGAEPAGGNDAVEAARAMLGDRPVVVLGRPSVAESAQSIVEAAGVLAQLPGVRFLSALRRGNVHGAIDAGLAPGLLPGRVSLNSAGDWFSRHWGSVPATAGLDTAGILAAAAAGNVHGLVLLGADPLSDFPDQQLARRALERASFVVAVDTFLNDSVQHADVVLPAATFAERPGTTTNIEGRITRLGQKITAPEVAWPDWMIAVELAARLEADLGFFSMEEISEEMERLAPAFAGVTSELLASRPYRDGVVIPLREFPSPTRPTTVDSTADPMSTPGVLHADDQGPTEPVPAADDEGDEVEVSPSEVPGSDGGANRPPLLEWDGRVEPVTLPKPDAYALRLVVGRKLYDRGVLVQMSPALAPLAAPPVLRAHPSDLDRLGVKSGGQVRLRSARLSATIEVQADPHQRRGTASVPYNVPGLDTGALLRADEPVTEIAIETL